MKDDEIIGDTVRIKFPQEWIVMDGMAQTAEAQRARFVEEFKNYGMLLDTMTPGELAVQIGENFPTPKQAALLAHMAARIIKLEGREDNH